MMWCFSFTAPCTVRYHSGCPSVVIALAVFLFIGDLQAETVTYFPVRGILRDNSGAPLETPDTIRFSIYAFEIDTVPIWSEIFDKENPITFENGIFSAYLGSTTELDVAYLSTFEELWLGISVDDKGEIGRVRFDRVPYAADALYCREIEETKCDDDHFLTGWFPENGQPICGTVAFSDIVGSPTSFEDGDDDTTYRVNQKKGVLLDENRLMRVDRETINAWSVDAAWATPPSNIDASSLDGFEKSDLSARDHKHYKTTVIVHPVGDGLNTIANGDELERVMETLPEALENAPILVKVEPGIYDIQADDGTHLPLRMKAWVDFEGSGSSSTLIRGPGSPDDENTGIIYSANHMEIRSLKVHNIGTTASEYSVGIYSRHVPAKITDVVVQTDSNLAQGIGLDLCDDDPSDGVTEITDTTVITNGANASYGIRSWDSAVHVENSFVRSFLKNDGFVAAISTSGSKATIDSVQAMTISLNDAVASGFRTYSSSEVKIYNSDITCTGAVSCAALLNDVSDVFIMNSNLHVADETPEAYGIKIFEDDSPSSIQHTIQVFGSRIDSSGPTIYSRGLFDYEISHSVLSGADMDIQDGSVHCAFVLDENYDVYTQSCP